MRNTKSNRVSVVIGPLATGKTIYNLGQYQRLSRAKLYSVEFPRKSTLTTAPDGTTIASDTTFFNGYLTLVDHENEKIIDAEPIFDYTPDTTLKPLPVFQGNIIDFTKSEIRFPLAASIDAGDVGKTIVVIFEYEEVTP